MKLSQNYSTAHGRDRNEKQEEIRGDEISSCFLLSIISL